MLVDLVDVTTKDGVRLDGALRTPDANATSNGNADVCILHHGLAGNFYTPGLLSEFSDALLASGTSVLRVNARGHDPVSRDAISRESYGGAYEHLDDCIHDWEAWIDFAEARGYQNITLWGHSLGGVKTIYYLAHKQDPRVRYAIATSPPRFSYSDYQNSEGWENFQQEEQRAQNHVDEGQPTTLMQVAYPNSLLITAEGFIDKYGPEDKYNILKLLPKVKHNLLATVGAKEGVVINDVNSLMGFRGLAHQLEMLSGELEHITFAPIPGGDHQFTGVRQEGWQIIQSWISDQTS